MEGQIIYVINDSISLVLFAMMPSERDCRISSII